MAAATLMCLLLLLPYVSLPFGAAPLCFFAFCWYCVSSWLLLLLLLLLLRLLLQSPTATTTSAQLFLQILVLQLQQLVLLLMLQLRLLLLLLLLLLLPLPVTQPLMPLLVSLRALPFLFCSWLFMFL